MEGSRDKVRDLQEDIHKQKSQQHINANKNVALESRLAELDHDCDKATEELAVATEELEVSIIVPFTACITTFVFFNCHLTFDVHCCDDMNEAC